MIPCLNFTYEFPCDIHSFCLHEVQFIYYNAKTHLVRFRALCYECDQKNGDRYGFYSTVSTKDWNQMTPCCDDPIPN